jgi:hypothetical protein
VSHPVPYKHLGYALKILQKFQIVTTSIIVKQERIVTQMISNSYLDLYKIVFILMEVFGVTLGNYAKYF